MNLISSKWTNYQQEKNEVNERVFDTNEKQINQQYSNREEIKGHGQVPHNDETWISLEQAFFTYDKYLNGRGGLNSKERS